MANRNLPQSPSLQDHVPNQMRIGIIFPSDPDIPEPELTSSPVDSDDGSDKLIGGQSNNFYDGRLSFLRWRARNSHTFLRFPPDNIWKNLRRADSPLHYKGNRAVKGSDNRLL